MKTFYKVCIVFTAIIALFFLVKWVNEVRPRYEWQEEIFNSIWYEYEADYCKAVEVDNGWWEYKLYNRTIKREDCLIFQDNHYLIYCLYNWNKKEMYLEKYDEDEYLAYEKIWHEYKQTDYWCYIKEKVRIN